MSYRSIKRRLKQGISVTLAAAMVAGSMPQTALTVNAEEAEQSTESVQTEETEKMSTTSEESTDEGTGSEEKSSEENSSEEASVEETSESESSESETSETEESESQQGTEDETAAEETTEIETLEEETLEEETAEEVTTEEETLVEETIEEEKLAEAEDTVNKALRFKMTPVSDWQDFIQQDVTGFEDITSTDKTMADYSIGYDLYVSKDAAFEGTYWVKTVTKLGAGWTWTEGSGLDVAYNNFADCEESDTLVKYTYKGKIGEGAADFDMISAIVVAVGSSSSTYEGAMFVDNVTLYDASDTAVRVVDFNDSADAVELGDLSGMEPVDLPEVEGEVALTTDKSAWSDGGAWEYTGDKTIDNVTIDDKTYLKVDLDYTNDVASSWAEAKLEYTHPETVASMNGYNTFKADVYYNPEAMTTGGFKIKVYNETLGIDDYPDLPKGTAVEGVEGLEGYYKAEFVLNYTSKDAAFMGVSIGIVGVNTDYKGAIYFDNMRFAQTKVDDVYVNTTIKAQKGAGITVSADGRSLTTESGQQVAIAENVALVDAEANEATKQLYAYLKAVGESDSVIFGHQNDTHHKAGSADLSNSDTKDITGSIAGVIGIDTLSLTGNEAGDIGASWDTPQSERVAAVADLTRSAAAEGAIITLSAHMPNFDVIDQRVKNFEANGGDTSDTLGYWVAEDGTKTYNFSGYTPGTLTGDVVTRIMPGQDLNYLYTAFLDMIAEYAKAVEKDGITILFRPFHENTGSWFWWGAALCDEQAYINLYRYTVDYLKDTKGVHNMLYVYGPGSEAANAEEYAERYPGDAYVDMIGYDLYHQYPSADNEAGYLAAVAQQNAILKEFANEHDKLYAITETGVANDSKALLTKDNEVKDWYMQLLDQISDDGVSYFLVWANWGENDSFYTPFVKSVNEDGTLYGHEMLDEFIRFYNDNRSVFATDMNNGYKNIKGVNNTTTSESLAGYITSPYSGARLLADSEENTVIKAKISGAKDTSEVVFVLTTDYEQTTLQAVKNADTGLYEAELSALELLHMGKGIGYITLMVDDETVAVISVTFNESEQEADPMIPDDFETYGNDRVLNNAWATNKATGSNIILKLTSEDGKVFGGSHALEMDFTLHAADGWAGATKSLGGISWAEGNAIEFYTIPESNAQKVVFQVTSDGKVFEVYLQEYENYTEYGKNDIPVKVTIPFEAFVGRDNKNAVFNPENIDSIGLWCNALQAEGVNFPLSTKIYYDEIRVVSSDYTAVTLEPTKEIETEGIHVSKIESAYTYTGKAIKPAITITDGNTKLKSGKDYKITYANNVNAGEATITITGKGSYAEKLKVEPITFQILPKEIDFNITAPEYIAYKSSKGSGAEQKVTVTVKDGSKKLKADKEYTLVMTYGDAVVSKVKECGEYTVSIDGIGNYQGHQELKLYVTDKMILGKTKVVLPSKSLPYNNGNAVEYSQEDAAKIKLSGKLIDLSQCEITYEDNTEVGKATIIITAKADSSDYAGYVKKNFDITGIPFKNNKIVIEGFESDDNVYTGKAVTQTVTVYEKGSDTPLTEGEHYTVAYSNNRNAGTAKMILTGKGIYTGTITKTFKIKQASLTTDMIIGADNIKVLQNKAGAEPEITIRYNGMTLKNGVDYQLTYSNNKKITTDTKKATITVTGKGNYTGKLKNAVAFEILPKGLNYKSEIQVVVADQQFKQQTAKYEPAVTVYDNGKKLTKNKDYVIVEYKGNRKEDLTFNQSGVATATVVIKAKEGSDYCTGIAARDELTVTFKIRKAATAPVLR